MITDIRLQNFRSYTDEAFEFDPGVNIIVGPNASGKTNLLEAIMVVSVGKSYRARDSELVAHDAEWARIDADTPKGQRTIKMIQRNGLVQKEYAVNEAKYKRLPLAKTHPIVLFEPNHLLLLSGSPELRRDYMDDLLERTNPGFSTLRQQYRRALAQRNALLKFGVTKPDQLFVWNIRLGQLGGEIATARLRLVDRISNSIKDLYRHLSNSKADITANYVSKCSTEQYSSDLVFKLEQTVQTDMERGFTGYGPHRDDLRIIINGRPTEEVASRGEVRTILLALKILELAIIEECREKKPILLLDDVFSELDGTRRRALTEAINGNQAFITTTDADIVISYFTQNARIIPTTKD